MTTTTTTALTEAERRQAAQLERVWKEPSGFLGWFQAVHHTTIGKRYMVTAGIFFLLAGILAGVMRLQLAFPEAHILSPDQYNQVFTMHGTTMMFLFAVPMMFEALSVYFVPLMVGTRNIAFPRLNAYSYYSTSAEGSCCSSRSSATPAQTADGSHMCRSPGRTTAPANGLTSGPR
jgi:cytochrome c oxidase subunit 1